ncbi:hypothetical protein ACQ4PT_002320 [Festuca glaucescens]
MVAGGAQWRVPVPTAFESEYPTAAVFCAADRCDHRDCLGGPFRVVFLFTAIFDNFTASEDCVTSACVYSSETGTWGEPTLLHGEIGNFTLYASVLVGNSLLYFLSDGEASQEYDLARHSLTVFDAPDNSFEEKFNLMLEENGELGVSESLDRRLNVWSRESSGGTAARWVLTRVIYFENLLPNGALVDSVDVLGFAEGANAIFVTTFAGLFMIQLQSDRVTKAQQLFNKGSNSIKEGDFVNAFECVSHDLKIRHSLTEFDLPDESYEGKFILMLSEKGELVVSESLKWRLDLWSREWSRGTGAPYVLSRVINLENLLPNGAFVDPVYVLGFAEGANAIFVRTVVGLFMIELQSYRVRKVCDFHGYYNLIPVIGFYTPRSRLRALRGKHHDPLPRRNPTKEEALKFAHKLFDKGCKATQERNFANASDCFSRALNISPRNFRICSVFELASKVGDAIPYCTKAISVCQSLIQNLENAKEALLAGKDVSSSAAGGHSGKFTLEDKISFHTRILGRLQKKLEELDQAMSTPSSCIDKITKRVVSQTNPEQNVSNTVARASSSTSQMAGSDNNFYFRTMSTTATRGSTGSSVNDSGIVSRGIKRANDKLISAEPSPKRLAADDSASLKCDSS